MRLNIKFGQEAVDLINMFQAKVKKKKIIIKNLNTN